MSIPVSTPAEPLDLQRLLAFCETERPWLIETIQRLVELESPTSDKSAVDAVVTELALGAGDLGGRVSRFANGDAGDPLRAEFGRGARQVLLLGHVDTVWPIGQLSRMPLRLEEGRLHGPGVFDMKAGIALGLLAVRALQQQRLLDQRKVVLLLTADEETGSRTSRAVVEAEAEASDAVLVLEPALPDGGVKTSRKGVGEFVLEVHGRAAHAGLEPERGVSAIVELAHQVLGLQALSDHAGGVSVTVGRVAGGARTNVVPDHARADIDVRVPTMADARRVCAAIQGLRPVHPGARLSVHGGLNRPPMERTDGGAALFEAAREVAASLGQRLTEGSSGGGSDGNFAAARGVPTIDGLGALGDGAHALHEHVLVEPLAWRAALIAGLVVRVP
jgi:glutamate carboxypeptidase